jgi:paraquat-inducible protein A
VSSTAAGNNLASCHLCCKLASASLISCPRCGSALHLRKSDSIQRSLALLIAALVLYFPANIYPIMYTDQFGATQASTILGGVILLIDHGELPIALVIFAFSVMVPTGKLMVMFYLIWTVHNGSSRNRRQLSALYRVTEFVGKWSMVDVFVVSILVALVHLGGFLVIRPGIAALSFAAVVILTMVAAESFDSRLMWDNMEENERVN